MATNITDEVSLVLSTLLDSFGLDEDTRQRRMDIMKMLQLLSSWYFETIRSSKDILYSGSAYETTTIDELSSDIDVMLIEHSKHIIDNIQQWKPNTVTYMMDNTGCYPAFVKLCLMSPEYPGPLFSDMITNIPAGHVVDEDGKILFRNDAMSKDFTDDLAEKHGPAVTRNFGVDVDSVFTLKCESFPKEAQHWKQRQTRDTRARMGGAIVDQAAYCYLVGVGNKGSPTEIIEWRLSFSHIENQLIHAWNNVQYKCYVMLKFIHKDIIKPNVPNCILCSYHYKTTLMWMVEEYPTEFFIESNFDKCILTGLHNLFIYVTRKLLPHYFVQGCNLFYNKLDKKSRKQITVVMEKILGTWPKCLWNIKRRKLGISLEAYLLQFIPLATICEAHLLNRKRNVFLFDLCGHIYLLLLSCKHLQDHILSKQHREVFKLLHNLVQRSKQRNFYYNTENKQFITFIAKDILFRVGVQLVSRSDTMTNKAALHYKLLGLGFIQRYISDCNFDTQLHAAEYFTRVGNYQRALLLLDNIEGRINDSTTYRCVHDGWEYAFPIYHVKTVFDKKPSLKECCKYYAAAAVTYTQDLLPHVPRTLVYEMFRSTVVSPSELHPKTWYSNGVIHCPIFLYYIRFLCFHALGSRAHWQVALYNMTWASKQLETSPCSHIETNHNIIGDCYRTLGQLHRAYREYRKSLLKQKYHNAAIWHMALILRRMVRSDR